MKIVFLQDIAQCSLFISQQRNNAKGFFSEFRLLEAGLHQRSKRLCFLRRLRILTR